MARRKNILIIILLLAAITPYFILCFAALPYADDFCYTWVSAAHMPFIARFMREYMYWSGRYSAHILLCNHPLTRGLIWYQIGDFVALAFTLLAVFIFFMAALRHLWRAVMVTLLMLIFYLCYMPQLSDGVYWFTGVCNYELSNAFFLLHLAMFILWSRWRGAIRAIFFITAVVSLIVSIGFNELGAVLIPAYYLFAVILLYRGGAASGIFRMAMVFFGIAFISAAFVGLAPGNAVRSHLYHDHFHVFHSLLFGSLQTARFTITWFATIPALILSLLVLALADRLPDTPLFRFDHRIIMIALLFTVYMSAFMPYLTTGILGQHRTINYAFFYFILLWLWWLISFSKQYSLYKLPGIALAGSISYAIIILSIVVMVFSANGGRMVRDQWKGNFNEYLHDYTQREKDLYQHPDIQVRPLRTIPETFIIVDAQLDTTFFVNRCMQKYMILRRQ